MSRKPIPYIECGHNLKRIRIAFLRTIEEFAASLGVPPGTVSLWERSNRIPENEIEGILKIFHIDRDALYHTREADALAVENSTMQMEIALDTDDPNKFLVALGIFRNIEGKVYADFLSAYTDERIDTTQINKWCVTKEQRAPVELVEKIIRRGYAKGVSCQKIVSLDCFKDSPMSANLQRDRPVADATKNGRRANSVTTPAISVPKNPVGEHSHTQGTGSLGPKKPVADSKSIGRIKLSVAETRIFCKKLSSMVHAADCPYSMFAFIVKKGVPLTEAVMRGCSNEPELEIKLADAFVKLLRVTAIELIDGDESLTTAGAEAIRLWKAQAKTYFDGQAQVLKDIRRERQSPVAELSSLTGIERDRYRSFEEGRSVPDAFQLTVISEALGVAVEELFVEPPVFEPASLKALLNGIRAKREQADDLDVTKTAVIGATEEPEYPEKIEPRIKHKSRTIPPETSSDPLEGFQCSSAKGSRLTRNQCSLFSERVQTLCEIEGLRIMDVLDVIPTKADSNFIIPFIPEVTAEMTTLLGNAAAVADFFEIEIGDLIYRSSNIVHEKCQAHKERYNADAEKRKHQGKLVKSYMDMLCMSSEDLAAQTGTAVSEIQGCVDGRTLPPDDVLVAMASFFEVPFEEFKIS